MDKGRGARGARRGIRDSTYLPPSRMLVHGRHRRHRRYLYILVLCMRYVLYLPR